MISTHLKTVVNGLTPVNKFNLEFWNNITKFHARDGLLRMRNAMEWKISKLYGHFHLDEQSRLPFGPLDEYIMN